MASRKSDPHGRRPPTGSAHSRREFVKLAGVAGLALATARVARAQGKGSTLKVGFISPRTGALAGFGETDGFVLDVARKALAPGLELGGKRFEIQILDRDSQSDPARASQLAKALIDSEKVDLMLVISTPEVVNPVSDACEAAGVPCMSSVMPWEAWYFGRGAKPGQPSPFKWTYHFSFGVDEFARCYASQWGAGVSNNRRVAALYPNDADGNAIREHLAPALVKAGFTVVDAGPYEDGTTDYSAQIAKFKASGCDIFNTFPIPPDFATFWRQAAQQGLTRSLKIVQVAKTGLFPSSVEALGSLGVNVATAAYWHRTFPYRSPLTGVSGVELADSYEKATGRQWNQQLGATMALLDAGFAAVKASPDPQDKAAVAKAMSALEVTTMVGKIDFAHGPVPNVATAPIIGCQWVKAAQGKHRLDLVITENAGDKNVPIGAKLIPYA
jgi:branched-chain amino acid transport system substrate-binding protein